MNPVILKYCGILSTRLEAFKIKTTRPTYKANCRCPVCGDSQKSKTKARGWIMEKSDGAIYYCFNCSFSTSFGNFLKRIDNSLYEQFIGEYKLDKIKTTTRIKKSDVEEFADKMKPPKFYNGPVGKWFKYLTKVSRLPSDHIAKKYVESRKIPSQHHHLLFYCEKFKHFTNKVIPGKFVNEDKDEPRLVIPFIDNDGNMFGFTGRSFKDDGLRYITIMIDGDAPKVFGMDRCNQNIDHMLVEGPIDSLFVNNCIAIAGGGTTFSYCNDKTIVCYDNEPRNIDTIKRMSAAIDAGFRIVIWPESIKEKDINLIVLKHPRLNISDMLYNNVYSGLEARLKLNAWSKV